MKHSRTVTCEAIARKPLHSATMSTPAGIPDDASKAPGDLHPELFAEQAHDVVDWIAGYLADPGRYPVLPAVEPGDMRRSLPPAAPDEPEPLDAIIRDFETLIVPGLTHWNHPRFLAYFAITGSAPGILAELLCAAVNVNAMLWQTSPAATELEEHVLDWLRAMLGLEPGWFGITTDTASISSLLALAAAREARAELAVRARGLAGRADVPVLRVYCSEHAHSSIDKAAMTLGIGHDNVVKIGADAEFRLRPDLLAAAVREDRERGFLPLAAVSTVGTTSTTSVDPTRAIADICARESMWLHVDAAYAGAAAVIPEMRWIFDGVEGADSLVVNPHKWLFTPVDCSAFWTRRPDILRRAFALVPDYLVTREQDEATNFMDYGVQLGHRFRALKLWFVLRAYGRRGLIERLEHHIALARELTSWIEEEPHWRVVAPVNFSVVCFRHEPTGLSAQELDRHNEELLQHVNASGAGYLSHTRLHGRYVIRVAIGNIRTERSHVREVWDVLRKRAGNGE